MSITRPKCYRCLVRVPVRGTMLCGRCTMSPMPNKPKTPHRTIRIDDELWKAAQAAAEREGKTITEVIRAALTRYVKRSKPDPDVADRLANGAYGR